VSGSVVKLMLEATEIGEMNQASVVGREQSNSTEKGLPWKLKGRLLSVFVAFSVAARITVRPKTVRSSVSTSLDRSRPD
jgi:hypothetical protein